LGAGGISGQGLAPCTGGPPNMTGNTGQPKFEAEC